MSTSNTAINVTSLTNDNRPSTLDSNARPSSRRRTVVVEKKTTAEALSEVGVNGAMDNKMVVNGKDLSHTIRGESVLERSKDLSHLKKGLIASTIPPKRKKTLPKPENSRWQTVLNVLTKNCLLLVALLWLGQTIWNWTNRTAASTNPSLAVFDYEGRISDVEASLKKAAKMLQIQLDVVDEKIGHEIGIVTRELTKQVEEKGALLEKELKKLEARTDSLDQSIGDMKGMGLLTKEEFENLWNELKKDGSLDSSGKDVALDEIRAIARSIVEKEIEKHAADGLGMVDYALASGGARVVRHSEPFVSGKANSWFIAAKGRNSVHANAQKMLEPSFGEPGQCFPLQGDHGFVVIKLRTGITPEAITLEHVSKSVAYDRSSAPKDCRVLGWYAVPEDDPSKLAEKMVFLVDFSYDLDKGNVQTFTVEPVGPVVINMIRLEFTSNHGSSALTCIYRFRVHGHEHSSAVASAMEA